MQTENRFFDDLARAAGGAMGALDGMRSEVETLFHQRMERVISDMNLVTREEFEIVEAMATTARRENENLKTRLDALEKLAEKSAEKSAPQKSKARKKSDDA